MNILDLTGREPVRASRTGWIEIVGGLLALAAAGWFLFYLLPAIIG